MSFEATDKHAQTLRGMTVARSRLLDRSVTIWSALYMRRGTRSLSLHQGRLIKRIDRMFDRGGQKKKDEKGPEAGDQHTVTEGKEIGVVVEAGDDAVRADAGEGSNTTQSLCLYYLDYTQHGANPMRVSISIRLYEIKTAAEKDLDVFAVRDLKYETRIMCDRPLIHLTQGNPMNVSVELAKLSPNKQALFLSLHCR